MVKIKEKVINLDRRHKPVHLHRPKSFPIYTDVSTKGMRKMFWIKRRRVLLQMGEDKNRMLLSPGDEWERYVTKGQQRNGEEAGKVGYYRGQPAAILNFGPDPTAIIYGFEGDINNAKAWIEYECWQARIGRPAPPKKGRPKKSKQPSFTVTVQLNKKKKKTKDADSTEPAA